jgi:hypothetical protein
MNAGMLRVPMHGCSRGMPADESRKSGRVFAVSAFHYYSLTGENMRIILAATALALVTGIAGGAEVRDWHDLDKVHNQIQSSIKEMERARAANHYDMAGHGAKAEQLLRDAEKELHEAVEAAKKH